MKQTGMNQRLASWEIMTKRNKTLAESFKGKPCVICSAPGEGDHIKHYAGDSRKDIEDNMWALCRNHHVKKHSMGLTTFVKSYGLDEEMTRRGFEFDAFYGGWLKKF